jgi:hypothetical protein
MEEDSKKEWKQWETKYHPLALALVHKGLKTLQAV